MSDIGVSVLCTTYNQADTVGRMLDSILEQRTTFDIEILVHDDASDDGTTQVLEKYQRDHPNQIRLFLEESNRFREPLRPGYFTGLLAPQARAGYVAFCEGDDFWCDTCKLQRQFEYMESHPACSECVHRALRVDASSGLVIDIAGQRPGEEDLTAGEVVLGWNVPTASRFIRRSLLARYVEEWVFDKPAGDFPLAMYLASRGYLHNDPTIASVYEFRRPGSYSSRTLSEEGITENARRWIRMLEEIDAHTGRLYHEPLLEYAIHYARILADWGEALPDDVALAQEACQRLGLPDPTNRPEGPEPTVTNAPRQPSLMCRLVRAARRRIL